MRVLWAGAGRMHVAPVGAQGAYGGSHLAVAECGGERSECRPAELAPPEPACDQGGNALSAGAAGVA